MVNQTWFALLQRRKLKPGQTPGIYDERRVFVYKVNCMIYNKMSIVVPKYRLNRWDKDSIRPGPVGSVGDVNLGVKLKKSSIELAERYDPTFSGKNEAWSGSNISDGMWYGWTSGGREATTISKAMPNIQTGGKTAIGWTMQNVVPTDRTRATKVTPLGRYGWDTTVGSVLKSKHTGDLFLPLPGGYEKSGLPRGSQFPIVVAESSGGGVALPAADIPITDPTFGDTGTVTDPGIAGCTDEDEKAYWAPALDDPMREHKPGQPMYGVWRYAWLDENGKKHADEHKYPFVGPDVLAWRYDTAQFMWAPFGPCGMKDRPSSITPNQRYVPPSQRPMPGNQDKRRQDRKKDQEDEKKKKQKLR